MENPPLARALHATVEIDQEIPQEHYRAVAEIIGYVMRLRGAFAQMSRAAGCKRRSGMILRLFAKISCAIQRRKARKGANRGAESGAL